MQSNTIYQTDNFLLVRADMQTHLLHAIKYNVTLLFRNLTYAQVQALVDSM